MKASTRKLLDQIGIILLIAGVVMAMGVSALAAKGLATWAQVTGLVVGLAFAAVGLWMARTFRTADPKRPHRSDS